MPFLPSMPTLEAADNCGQLLEMLYCICLTAQENQLVAVALLEYQPDKKLGSSPRTFHYKGIPGNWLQKLIGPNEIAKVINPSVVQLKLPSSLKIHQLPGFLIMPSLSVRFWMFDIEAFKYLVNRKGCGLGERSWIFWNLFLDCNLLNFLPVVLKQA